MNNNMPNGFNNGMPIDNPLNNDPAAMAANQQLIGGQSSVGNGPELMQGMQSAQNERGVMQGMDNVQNSNNPAQGMEIPNPNENNAPMPGQFNTGLNNYTMNVETPSPTELQANTQNPEPQAANFNNEPQAMPDNQMNIPNMVNPMPQPVMNSAPPINPMGPEPNMNNNMFDNLRTEPIMNEPSVNINTPVMNSNMMPQNNDMNLPGSVPEMPTMNEPLPQDQNMNLNIPPVDNIPPVEPNINIAPMDNGMEQNINPNIPQMGNEGSVDLNVPNVNQNANEPEMTPEQTYSNPFAMNNANLGQNLNGQMPNPINEVGQPVMDNVPPMNPMGPGMNVNPVIMDAPPVEPSMATPVMDMPQENQIGSTQDLNSVVNEGPVNIPNNVEPSNEAPINYDDNNFTNEGEPKPSKKFPLSLRETILVTIALIGIIIVVIMYWPN